MPFRTFGLDANILKAVQEAGYTEPTPIQSAAIPQASAGERHRFRLAAKKFRYTLELFAEFYGPAAAHWTAQVKGLQSLLGAMNDCRAVRDLVETLGGNPKVEASLKKRQRRKTLEFRRAWAAHFGVADAAKQWIEWLSRII